MKKLSRVLGIVFVVELVLVIGNILPPHITAPIIVATECTALVLGGSIAIRAAKEIKNRTQSGERVYTAVERSLDGVLPPKILFMVKHEIGIFVSLGRWVARRKDIPAGAVEIKYGHRMRVLIAILIAGSIVEITAVELLVPFVVLRWAFLLIGVYALFWVVGLMAATIVYPHYATANELVIRFFHYHTIRVPLTPDCRVAVRERTAPKNKTIIQKDGMLSLYVLSSTNVSVELPESTEVTVDGAPALVSTVSFDVDDPKALRGQINEACEKQKEPREWQKSRAEVGDDQQ